MSDPEPIPEQPLAAEAAQAVSPASPAGAAAPSLSPVPALQPDQQPIELERSQHQAQQETTRLDNTDHQQQPPLPPFQPLFTLVTDSTTGATHHARVHYIFSDDEPDLLTDALGQYSTQQQQQQQTASSSSGSTSAKPTPPTTNRAILLDLVPKPSTSDPSSSSSTTTAPAYDVAWASSLSPDWAVVSAKVNHMSADDNNDAADTSTTTTPARGADGALMLRIEGVDLSRPPRRTVRSKASAELSSGSSSGVGQPAQQEEYAAIVDEFDKRMVVLRKVLVAGRERQLKMAVDADGAEVGPAEPPAADVPGRSITHGSVGHEQPEGRPSGARQTSDGSGAGQQGASKRLSGGSGGRAEWEQQPVG